MLPYGEGGGRRGCVEGKAIGERQEGFDEGFPRPHCRGGPLPWETMTPLL